VIELALTAVLGAIGNAVIVEVHCRLQKQHITKPKNTLNLIKHYLLMLPFIFGMLFFVYIVKLEISNLGLTSLNSVLLLLGIVILFLSPLIYIMDWRYPGLANNMASWRKGLSKY